jgi:hypothetical protein
MKRMIVGLATTALVSGSLALTGLGVGAGVAQAERWCTPDAMVNGLCYGPNQWCPGDSLFHLTQNHVANPVTWDMNVCHTYFYVPQDQGNVAWGVYEGPTPPPPNAPPPPAPNWTPPLPEGMCWAMWVPAPCPNG